MTKSCKVTNERLILVNNSTVTVVANVQIFFVCFLNFEVLDEAHVFQKFKRMLLNICVCLLLANICTLIKSWNLGQEQNCRYKNLPWFQLMPIEVYNLGAVILPQQR